MRRNNNVKTWFFENINKIEVPSGRKGEEKKELKTEHLDLENVQQQR